MDGRDCSPEERRDCSPGSIRVMEGRDASPVPGSQLNCAVATGKQAPACSKKECLPIVMQAEPAG